MECITFRFYSSLFAPLTSRSTAVSCYFFTLLNSLSRLFNRGVFGLSSPILFKYKSNCLIYLSYFNNSKKRKFCQLNFRKIKIGVCSLLCPAGLSFNIFKSNFSFSFKSELLPKIFPPKSLISTTAKE